MRFLYSIVLCFMTIFFADAQAMAPQWDIDIPHSQVVFIGQKGNMSVRGYFTQYTQETFFSPDLLDESHVKIIIKTSSLQTGLPFVADLLMSEDWFYSDRYPLALFESQSISKVFGNLYQVKGLMTIRDKTLPMTFHFKLNHYTQQQAQVTGTFHLKRTQFGVGQGEWADINDIKDEVEIRFEFELNRR